MSGMFYGELLLGNLDELKNWKTTNLIKINYTFKGCSSLKNLKGLKNWDII